MDRPTNASPNTASTRRVLGDVSPNVASQSPAFLRKAAVGSPLKRSFTAAMEGGEGLAYLKRRKLSEGEGLSHGVSYERAGERGWDEGEENTLPSIAEPEPSPTEPNTPTDSNNDNPTSGSSADRNSFSSLINYDPSSQTSNLVFKTVSNAELLKLRLRIAMYKVRTNQIDVAFQDLHVDEPPPTGQSAVEAAVAQLRREAQEVQARQAKVQPPGKLLPAPVLKPTAYSSRTIYETPSSPPASGSASPDKLPAAPTMTPARPQLSSPPSTGGGRFAARLSEQELTSSVVKGRVAEGLLGLRNAS